MFYGHSLPEQPESAWQTLDEHHCGVAELASAFAGHDLAETAELLGSIHDIGKRSDSFQNRLRGKGGKVDHTTAAYLYLLEEWKNSPYPQLGEFLAETLAYPLLGHHGGMPDYGSQAEEGTLQYRIKGKRVNSVPDWKKGTLPPLPGVDTFAQQMKKFMMCDNVMNPICRCISSSYAPLLSCRRRLSGHGTFLLPPTDMAFAPYRQIWHPWKTNCFVSSRKRVLLRCTCG